MTPIADLGPTGITVAENVKHFRERAGLTYTTLARRTEELGYPIPTLGLRRIEAHARRVNVDDLMVLAAVLDVSPMALVLPPEDESPVRVTGQPHDASVTTVREWMLDIDPLRYALGLIRESRDALDRARTDQRAALASMADKVTDEKLASLQQASQTLNNAQYFLDAVRLVMDEPSSNVAE